jgi:hypothetical protein
MTIQQRSHATYLFPGLLSRLIRGLRVIAGLRDVSDFIRLPIEYVSMLGASAGAE